MKPVKLKLIKIKPTRTKSIIKPIIKPVKHNKQHTKPKKRKRLSPFIENEISFIMSTFEGVIKGIISRYRTKFPLLSQFELVEEIESEVIYKLTAGILNRTIQLYKISDKQLNVMIQRITTNVIIDTLRRIQKESGGSTDELTSATSLPLKHKYTTSSVYDKPDMLLRMNDIHLFILNHLEGEDKQLYIDLYSGPKHITTNNPKVVELKKKVKLLIEKYNEE